MRGLTLVLLASAQLTAARSRGFNVFEDLLTFPQFEVSIAAGWITEKDAQALIDSNQPQPTFSTDLSHATHAGDDHATQLDDVIQRAYEIMKLSSSEYLCSIPLVEQPSLDNETDSELAKVEEARELSRATTHGWELLSGLEESCLLFVSGWWTYRFCKNREIVQFHVSASTPAGQAIRDPIEYVLGAVPAIPTSSLQKARRDPDTQPLPAEVQVKGDQRYLVQKLEGGTICDLTGRERTIEVQYHCVPGLKQDRISWIKEVTICAYLMVVNTPRLCEDVAFLPPKEAKAHQINCQLILHDDATPPLLEQDKGNFGTPSGSLNEKRVSDVDAQGEKPLKGEAKVVGGIVVGARNILSAGDEDGKPPVTLKSPREDREPADKIVEMIAQAASKADGGKVEVLSLEEMDVLDVDPKMIEEMRAELEKLAGDGGWRLDLVEIPGEDIRELRGYVDGDEDEEEEQEDDGKPEKKGSQEQFYRDEL